MTRIVATAGERLLATSELAWVGELIAEAVDVGALEPTGDATVQVVVERAAQPFSVGRPRLVSRGTTAGDGGVVVANVCASGFDLHLDTAGDVPVFRFRWRPPRRERAAALVLRARFRLLARAVLVQYPALWQATRRGRAPLHASGLDTGSTRALVSGAAGVGRSTLLLREAEAGAATTGDNVCVGDGTTVWGLVEPWRVDSAGGGPRTTHGRRELAAPNGVASVVPECIVVLERSREGGDRLAACSQIDAARRLATSTYMAGELRRFWPFVATLAAATGTGPAHPPVADVAAGFAAALPCLSLELAGPDGPLASALLADREGVAAWAC
jgi:hypothetical protein